MDFESLVPALDDTEISKSAEDEPIVDNTESPWLFNGKPIDKIPSEHKTFVYMITNIKNGKRYIGFKTSVSKKTKVVNHKKRKIEVESDWKSYWSSSEVLHNDVLKYGKSAFMREIMYFTVNKAVGKYIEAYEQFTRNALTSNGDGYYNGIVNLRIGKRTVGKWTDVKKAEILLGDKIAKQFGYN